VITAPPLAENLTYEALTARGIAPDEGFDSFVVGDQILKARDLIKEKIESLADGSLSQTLVIIGDNGNGKTLLNNMVKAHLSKLNEDQSSTSRLQLKSDYFFAHIKAHNLEISKIGQHFFTALQLHLKVEPTYTYSLISVKLFRDFLNSYKPPWYVRLNPLRLGTKALTEFLDGFSLGIFSEVLGEVKGTTFDQADKRVQAFLGRRHWAEAFEQYYSNRPFGAVLAKYYSQGRGTPISPETFRTNVANALENTLTLRSSNDAIRIMRDVARLVNAKVLVLLVDDANDLALLDNLQGFIDGLDDLDRTGGREGPRVLLVLSIVQEIYRKIVNTSASDKSLPQRISFTPPVVLEGPGRPQIEQLVDRLISLRWFSRRGKSNRNYDKAQIAQDCQKRTYREAISCISKMLEG
jgi:hypothetical protein